MKKFLLIFCLLLYELPLFSQDHKTIDSLGKIIPLKKDTDPEKAYLLCKLAFEYSYIDLDSGLALARMALDLNKKSNDSKGMARTYNVMGTIYYDKADYKMATEVYMNALRECERCGNLTQMALVYGNLSLVQSSLNDFGAAKRYAFESIKLCRQTNTTFELYGTYQSLGNLYLRDKKTDSALFYFDLALQTRPNDKAFAGIIHSSKAWSLTEIKQYDKAEKEIQQAIEISRELKSDYYYYQYLTELAEIYMQVKRFDEAEKIFMQSLSYAKRSSLKDNESAIYNNLSLLYEEKRDFKTALYYHRRFFNLFDSIKNTETSKITAELEKQYEDEKKRAQINKLNLEKLASETENKRKDQLLLLAIVVCALVLAAFGFAIYAFINKRKANIELHALHKEVSDQKNELFDKNKNITDSIQYAQRIQKALLSSRAYIKENVNDFFIIHKPKDIVSGDFYWAQRSGDELFFMLADCTGHGVPGAFMSLLGISYLNELVVGQMNKDTDKILNGLRANIIQALTDNTYEIKDGMDGVLCRFNFRKLHLQYSAANNSVVIIRDKNIIELNGNKMPVGRSPRDKENFTAHEFELKKNDMVYLFTDGFPDQFGGEKGKKLKERTLKDFLVKVSSLSMEEQEKELSAYFAEWKGSLEQIDDVCLAGFRI